MWTLWTVVPRTCRPSTRGRPVAARGITGADNPLVTGEFTMVCHPAVIGHPMTFEDGP